MGFLRSFLARRPKRDGRGEPGGTRRAADLTKPIQTYRTNGTGNGALFNGPSGIAVDIDGNIYAADTRNGTIRMVTPAGVVTTLAGTPGVNGYEDDLGAAARFNSPTGLTMDEAGNLYVADTLNNAIREIALTGAVTTIAGNPNSPSGSANAAGPAAQFFFPTGVAVDNTGAVYVADAGNRTIRKGMLSIATGNAAPTFTAQPVSESVSPGNNATFSVATTGNPTPTFRWQHLSSGSTAWVNLSDNGSYSGSATPTLTVNGATVGMSNDQFRCLATNDLGRAASSAATLTVTVQPTTTIPSQSNSGGGGGGAISFWFIGALSLLAGARKFGKHH